MIVQTEAVSISRQKILSILNAYVHTYEPKSPKKQIIVVDVCLFQTLPVIDLL